MPVSLDDENRVAIPRSALGKIADLDRERAGHVQTQLLQITEAGYTPTKLVYKQYGDLKVFRCGGEMRIFGVVLENLTYLSDFDHLVVVLTVSEHEYESAGVQRRQAQRIHARFANVDSEAEFYDELRGDLFDSSMVEELL